jgi:murein DD-endopeptidase MepM/ murein hydrolase activator NlpD
MSRLAEKRARSSSNIQYLIDKYHSPPHYSPPTQSSSSAPAGSPKPPSGAPSYRDLPGSPLDPPSDQGALRLMGEAEKALETVNNLMGWLGVGKERQTGVSDSPGSKLLDGLNKSPVMSPGRTDYQEQSLTQSDPWHLFSGFGGRVHPATGENTFHAGIDVGPAANRIGTNIPAVGEGVVEEVRPNWGTAGNTVVVKDPRTGYEYLYKHLDTMLVSVGQKVDFKQPIGTMGNTGRTVGRVEGGAHLDIEIRDKNGKAVDPIPWLAAAVQLKGYKDYYGSGPYTPTFNYATGGLFE